MRRNFKITFRKKYFIDMTATSLVAAVVGFLKEEKKCYKMV